MLGLSHAVTSLSAGLVIADIADATGCSVSAPGALVLSAFTGGAALLADLDTPTSTASRMLSRSLAGRINALSMSVYRATRTPQDDARRDGHRGVTHSAIAALLVGCSVIGLGLLAGSWGGALVAAVLLGLVRRALFGPPRRKGMWVVVGPLALPVIAVALLSNALPNGFAGAVLLGSAVAVGMLVHDLGGVVTDGGVPLLWPARIKGQRWFRVRLPKGIALTTGGPGEVALLLAFCLILFVQIQALLSA